LIKNLLSPSGLLTPRPNWPVSPPSPPGWAKPVGSGLGRSNRPSPAPTRSPPPLLDSPWRLDRRRRLASPASSGELSRYHLRQNMHPCDLYHSTEWIRQTPPPRGDRGGSTLRDLPPLIVSGWVRRRALLSCVS
jgi:hypothetical protein